MCAIKIRYDDGTTELLTDSGPGLSAPEVGHRDWMPRAAQCASSGWYTVVAVVSL